MFQPKENPNYGKLSLDAAQMITQWTKKTEWYETSSMGSIQ